MRFFPLKLLPQGLFKACVTPRPIAWISTIDKKGNVNLAPFSYFNIVCDDPAMVMFATTSAHVEGGPKDSLRNAEETGEFVVNIPTFALREAVNLTSADLSRCRSEFEFAKLEHEPSELVKAPRVKGSPINLECAYYQSVQLPISPGNINRMVIGRVLGIHVCPSVLTDGKIDLKKLQLIARLGYNDYEVVGKDQFSMIRPKVTDFFSSKNKAPLVAAQPDQNENPVKFGNS